jgi:hypothetical protein
MLCEHCRKKIIIKRHLWNLFEPHVHHLCEQCYARYPLLPTYETIPIEGGIMHLYTLISKPYPVEPKAYQSFLGSYIVMVQKRYPKHTLFLFDSISSSLFDMLDHVSFGDLVVVRLYENSHDKGEKP